MNQQRRRVDAVFVCLRLACTAYSSYMCAAERNRERECVRRAQQGVCWEGTAQGFSVLPLTEM